LILLLIIEVNIHNIVLIVHNSLVVAIFLILEGRTEPSEGICAFFGLLKRSFDWFLGVWTDFVKDFVVVKVPPRFIMPQKNFLTLP